MTFLKNAAALIVLSMTAMPVLAQDVTRHPIPNSDFPILQAVEVPAGKTTVYLSGTVPVVINEGAEKTSVEAYGTTEQQTVSVSATGIVQGHAAACHHMQRQLSRATRGWYGKQHLHPWTKPVERRIQCLEPV